MNDSLNRGVLNKIYGRISAVRGVLPPYRGKCCLCNKRIGKFLPYKGGRRGAPPLMQVLAMSGSDLDNHACPACGCHDRERHLFLYFNVLELPAKMRGRAFLHFAPEARFSFVISTFGLSQYVKADLHPVDASVQGMDIHQIPYPENSFDYVMANHVLEHVSNDLQALSEVRRVLKPGGFAILQTPFSQVLAHTHSDEGVKSPQARLQLYGQEDHVRIFGRDIFERFMSVGYRSHVCQHSQIENQYDARFYGVNREEPFFLFQRV